MKTCPFCQLENDDRAEACEDCGTEFGGFNRSATRKDRLAYTIAIIHFSVSFVVVLLALNEATAGLGDGSVSDSSYPGLFSFLLIILEAPVALIQWILVKCCPQAHLGLGIFGVFIFMAVLWSIAFGWLAAILYRKIRKNW